jgi:cytochrome c biogenesis protein CcmG, thiol:disulfide interchange protein DsbE
MRTPSGAPPPRRRRGTAPALLGLAAVALLGWLFAASLGGTSTIAAGVDADRPVPAPSLSGSGPDGRHHDLERLRGQVVLVNVWASWCAPCRDEIPLLVEAAEEHRDDGLRLLGLNTSDRADDAAEFLSGIGATDSFPTVHDPDGRRAVAWGARGVPETFVVDRDGQVVARAFGEVTEEWLAEEVLPVLRW